MAITSPITLFTPLPNGLGIIVTQGPGGATSHFGGDLFYSWDFDLADGSEIVGTSVHAVADGEVVFVEERVRDGRSTLNGQEIGFLGNVVTIRHEVDGQIFYSSYFHLKEKSVPVEVGQTVRAGQQIGSVGDTGTITGSHLHLTIGETVGNYTNSSGEDIDWYQVAEGNNDDNGAMLALVEFADSPSESGELPTDTQFTSTTVIPGAVYLSDIAEGKGGLKIIGENAGDGVGRSVSSAGDVNGDGFDDLLIGAFGQDSGGDGAGAAYVVFGGATPPTSVNLDDVAAGAGGFKIVGENPSDGAGFSLSSAGDVNGDGFDDLLIGAFGQDSGGDRAGAAYVVFGGAISPTSVNLDDVAAGTDGYKIIGEDSRDVAGISISSAGDVNGDGFDDLLIGAPGEDSGGDSAGAAYVVFGGATPPTSVNLDDVAAGVGGFRIVGENEHDAVGSSVSFVGDVNGDGFDDLLIGAYGQEAGGQGNNRGTEAGAAYVVFGGASLPKTVNLNDVALGTGGFKIVGENTNDHAAIVSFAGDINGDGFNDLVVGAPGQEAGGNLAGAVYVVFGGATPPTSVNLDDVAAGAGGFKIVGENASDRAGESVSLAGDVNGDGFGDLLIGASGDDNSGGFGGIGAAYVVFGNDSTPTTVSLDDVAAGIGGFKIIGEELGDIVGRSVSSAGDVNGDGIDDLLIGAFGQGAAYLIYGDPKFSNNAPTNWSIDPLTPNVEELAGTLTFNISRLNANITETVYVSTTQVHGSTNQGDYFGQENEPLTFEVGETTKTLTISINDDADFPEGDETFGLVVQADPDDPIETNLASTTFTILDEAPAQVLNITGLGTTVAVDTLLFKANIGGSGFDTINKIILTDDGDPVGGSGGVFSGFDLDAFFIDLDGNLSTSDDQITPTGIGSSLSFLAGTTRPTTDPSESPNPFAGGPAGPVPGPVFGADNATTIDTAVSTLGVFDAVGTGSIFSDIGYLTLGDGGKIVWSFDPISTKSFPNAALFFGEVGGQSGEGLTVKAVGDGEDQGPPELAKPTDQFLEIFARKIAYDDDLEKDDQTVDGYVVNKVFDIGAFEAVGLIKPGAQSILAVRGTNNLLDVLTDFNSLGVGVGQFSAAWPEIRTWLAEQTIASLTGHSLGGALAQLIASEATSLGFQIGSVVTFNSPGISEPFADKFDVSLSERVKHFISSGDAVSHAGEQYLPGEVTYYNFSQSLLGPIGALLQAHVQHWSQQEIYSESKYTTALLDAGYDQFDQISNYESASTSITSQGLSSPIFSHLWSGDSVDAGYFATLLQIASVNFLPVVGSIGPAAAVALTTRGSTEAARSVGLTPIRDALELAADGVQIAASILNAAVSVVSNWSLATAMLMKDWTVDTWIGFLSWGADTWDAVREWTVDTWQSVVGWGANTLKAIGDLGSAVGSAAVETIQTATDVIVDTGSEVAWDLYQGTTRLWEWATGSGSPEIKSVDANGTATASEGANTILVGDEASNQLVGNTGDDIFLGGPGKDNYKGGGGDDIFVGTAADLNEDEVDDYNKQDEIFVAGEEFSSDDLSVGEGSAILQIDTDQDGIVDTVITLNGTYELDAFNVEARETGTAITYSGNVFPVAADDKGTGFITNEDQPFTTKSVLLNDTDVDADDITVGDLDLTETKGLVTDNGNGTFEYDPNGAFEFLNVGETATDSFIYTANDGNGGTANATVSIDVNGINDAPVLTTNLGQKIDEGAVGVPIIASTLSASDVDNSPADLTYRLNRLPEYGTLYLNGLALALGGTFTQADINSGLLTFDHDGSKAESDSFGFDLSDGEKGISGQTFKIVFNQTLNGTNWRDHLIGGEGDDHINGFRGSDILEGNAGDDELIGGSGWDDLDGGSGDDFLDGGSGSDDLVGGDGDDELIGGSGWDDLDGGSGDDFLDGGSGSDDLFGGDGNDDLIGGGGWDDLDGGTGNDLLDGGDGLDDLEGGEGNDTLLGGDGRDDLSGGAGEDTLDGGEDRDTLNGGIGDDILTGGEDRDTFIFAPGDGNDTITDFDVGSSQWFRQFFTGDRIDVRTYDFDSDDDVLALATQDGADTVIQLSESDSIRLVGVDVDDLDTFDFYT